MRDSPPGWKTATRIALRIAEAARRVRAVAFSLAVLLVCAPATDAAAAEISGPTPRAEVLALALRARACARAADGAGSRVLTVIDYSLPSTAKRLWVIDLEASRTLFHELVAHGRGSGENRATRFSDEPGSKESSLGVFRTADTYQGRHGYTLRLDGLEPGVNGNARARAIVIHGADYATAAFAERHGRLGRSWGCPVVDPAVHRPLIDTIAGGSLLFVYGEDDHWLATSELLHCSAN